MVVFLNELSLEEHNDWPEALTLFWRIASTAPGESLLFRDGNFFQSGEFAKRFNLLFGMLPPDLRSRIREMSFSERYWKCWRPERVSDPEEAYECEPPGRDLRDCSISEGAEYMLQIAGDPVGAASAADSCFGQSRRIRAKKSVSGEAVELVCISELRSWQQVLASQRGHFDPTLNQVPRDFQTVLVKDPVRFRSVGRVEPGFGRKVYEEVSTGRLFYVDEGHPGHSAHLEVFDSLGQHLGIADIASGELDSSQLVTGRSLDN